MNLKIVKNAAEIPAPAVKVARGQKALNEMAKAVAEAPAKRARKAAVEVVQAVVLKPKNPVQIRHLRAEVQPKGKAELIGVDTLTACGRIVVKQMTRKGLPTGATVAVCPQCVDNDHINNAFEIVRGG